MPDSHLLRELIVEIRKPGNGIKFVKIIENQNQYINMKKILLLSLLLFSVMTLKAQKFITKNGFIEFYGETPFETIKAGNNQVASIIDTQTGELVFQVLMKSFHFERALMEEHFNENFVESDKYPKSVFKGKITDPSKVDFKKDGVYNVQVEGELSIHNVTKKISEPGTIEIADGRITARSKFKIRPEDYNIEIPSVVRDKVAKEMDVTVDMKYEPLAQ